jgi:hypothetical protein
MLAGGQHWRRRGGDVTAGGGELNGPQQPWNGAEPFGSLLIPLDGKWLQQRWPELLRLPSVQDRLNYIRRQHVSLRTLPTYPRSIFSAAATSLMVAYRPSSNMRFQRNARASAFTMAGSAPILVVVGPLLPSGVTTVLRPRRCRMARGARTVMLVAALMPLSPSGRRVWHPGPEPDSITRPVEGGPRHGAIESRRSRVRPIAARRSV